MKTQYYINTIKLFLLIAIAFYALPHPTFAGSGTIGNAETKSAEPNTTQKKTITDSVTGQSIVFYQDGAVIKYSYSKDGGNTWIAMGSLAYDSGDFAINYKELSGVGNVFVVVKNGFDVVMRRGVVSQGSIVFEGEVMVFDGDGASNYYEKPTVAFDAGGSLWVSGIKRAATWDANEAQAYVKQSTQVVQNGVAISFNTANAVGEKGPRIKSAVLVPRQDAKMFMVMGTDSGGVLTYLYDGVKWNGVTVGSEKDYTWFSGGIGWIRAMAATADGRVYVGGYFLNAFGDDTLDYLIYWDGNKWRPLGTGPDSEVLAIAVSGNDVYIGGYFSSVGGVSNTRYVAHWDGSDWHSMGGGANGTVYAIAASGNDVYVGGSFSSAGGIPRIAHWDGSAWNALGSGVDGTVYAITVSGSNAYVGGSFSSAVGVLNTKGIARWNGSAWSSIGTGLSNEVRAIVVSGNNIYAGGRRSFVGAEDVARWDGNAWNAIGTGFRGDVRAMALYGSDLYVVGPKVLTASGVSGEHNLLRWNGSAWDAPRIESGSDTYAIATSGSNLYVGGYFEASGRWDGSAWHSFGGWPSSSPSLVFSGKDLYAATYRSLALWDGNSWSHEMTEGSSFVGISGSDVYVGVWSYDACGIADADYIVRWDGNACHALGTGLDGYASVGTVYGGNVYVAGGFTSAGGVPNTRGIARWNGTTWGALGTGIDPGRVYAIAANDNYVYAGGIFTNVGLVSANNVARWNVSSNTWESLDTGITGGTVYAVALSGNYVYVGGDFTSAGGAPASRFARWHSQSNVWEPLNGINNGRIRSILVSSSDIYVGGTFTDAGGITEADGIARWDGISWHKVMAFPSGDGACGIAMSVEGTLALTGCSEGQVYIAYPAASGFASNTSQLSAATDASNNLHVTYLDSSQNLKYKQYDNTLQSLSGEVTLRNASVSSPNLLYDEANDALYSFYLEGGNLYGLKAATPIGMTSISASDWEATPMLIGEANANEVSVNLNAGKIVYSVNSGAGAPYLQRGGVLPEFIVSTDAQVPDGLYRAGAQIPIVVTFSNNVTVTGAPRIKLNSGSEVYAQYVSGSGTNQLVFMYEVSNGDGVSDLDLTSVAIDLNGGSIELSSPGFLSDPMLSLPEAGAPGSLSYTRNIAINTTTFNISGTCTKTDEAQTPLEGVSVLVGSNNTSTLADGSFAVSGVARGVYKISASKDGYKIKILKDEGSLVNYIDQNVTGDVTNIKCVATPSLSQTVYAPWNGYLDMVNIMEVINTDADPLTVTATVYDIQGKTGAEIVYNATFSIAGNDQRDFIINDLPGFRKDTYGLVKLETSTPNYDGRVSYYRWKTFGEDLDFAFSVPFMNVITGKSYVGFNTYSPDVIASNREVYNWLSVMNLSTTGNKRFYIYQYDNNGKLIETKYISVPPMGRRDVDGGHINPGKNAIGYHEIVPEDLNAPYEAFMTRLGGIHILGDYRFGNVSIAGAGIAKEKSVFVNNFVGGSNYAEVVNKTKNPVKILASYFDPTGVLLNKRNLEFGAGTTIHLNSGWFLPEWSQGTLLLEPETPDSILVESLRYDRDAQGFAKGVYGVRGEEGFGIELYGSYNLFLNQDNWLQVTNTSSSDQNVTVQLYGAGQEKYKASFIIKAHERKDFGLHDLSKFKIAKDSYGVVKITCKTPGVIVADVVRGKIDGAGEREYFMATPVR